MTSDNLTLREFQAFLARVVGEDFAATIDVTVAEAKAMHEWEHEE